MKIVICILFALCTVINLSGCSTFRTISLVKAGESLVRPDEETVIPFGLSGSMILVKARINDSSHDNTFILNTSTLTVIGKDVANNLGLSKEVEVELMDYAGGKEKAYLTKLKSVAIGGFKADGISAHVFDLSRIRRLTGIKVDGFIGSNYLRFFKVKIDYQKRLITLSSDTAPGRRVPGESLLRIKQPMKLGFAPQVKVSCGGNTFDAIIDTGLNAPLTLPPSLLEEISRQAGIEGKGVMSEGAFSDYNKVRLIRLNGFRIGSREIGNVVATVTEGQEYAYIGYSLLSNYVVTLNYPAGEMLLTPAEGGRIVDNFFTTGINARRDENGRALVSGVWNGSPADRLGITMGNEIIKVNGKAASDFTLQELHDQMRDDDRITAVDLLIRNQIGEKNVTIKKEFLFRGPVTSQPTDWFMWK